MSQTQFLFKITILTRTCPNLVSGKIFRAIDLKTSFLNKIPYKIKLRLVFGNYENTYGHHRPIEQVSQSQVPSPGIRVNSHQARL